VEIRNKITFRETEVDVFIYFQSEVYIRIMNELF